jgi:hypothetical protein
MEKEVLAPCVKQPFFSVSLCLCGEICLRNIGRPDPADEATRPTHRPYAAPAASHLRQPP